MAKIRSPNYPVVDLATAVELTGKIYKQAQQHPMPAAAVVKTVWGLKPESAYGRQCLGALRQYGLIQARGEGERREVRITSDAAKILENHPEKPSILSAMAIAPKVNGSIWEKFGPFSCTTMPPDETLKHFLLFDYEPKFNSSSLEGFLKTFRSTIEYSQIGLLGNLSDNKPISEIQDVEEVSNEEREISTRVQPKRPGMRQEVFTLDEGDITLQWPERLSLDSYQDFESWLQLVLRKAKRAIVDDAPNADSED